MRGGGESHGTSGQEMAAQQETEAVWQDAMQQPAGGVNKRWRCWQRRRRRDKRTSMDAMQAGSDNNNKSSMPQSKNCFERSAEGGLREVTREFGGQWATSLWWRQ
jgi:hypothetical protein